MMGLFGGVSQADVDKVNFTLRMAEMKAAQAMQFSDLKYSLGCACGYVDAVSVLVQSKRYDEANTLYRALEVDLVNSTNRAIKVFGEIKEVVNGLGDAGKAYLNYLEQDKNSLTNQCNNANELIGKTINLIKTFDDMFDVKRD